MGTCSNTNEAQGSSCGTSLVCDGQGKCVPQQPTVTATSPVNGAQGAAINSFVKATFSVTMNPATITASTFLLRQGVTPVPGAVTYAGTIATFAPTADYSPGATLTATVTTGAKDLSGNALAQDHVWSFQTGTKAGQAPVALGLASPFAVLAGDMVDNTVSAGTLITGDVGISPGTSLAGFPPGVITGGTYKGAAAAGAQADLLAAYSDAAGRPGAAALPADVGDDAEARAAALAQIRACAQFAVAR